MPDAHEIVKGLPLATTPVKQDTTPVLTPPQMKYAQRLMTQEGSLWSFMNAIVIPGGLVMTAFALYLKADAFIIGLVSALPLAAALLQIWTPWLVVRYGSRKKVCLYTIGLSRLLLLPLAFLALLAYLWPGMLSLWLIGFLLILTIFSILNAIGGTTWLSWATTIVPLEKRSSYFSRRNTYIGAIGLVMTFAAGVFMDSWVTRTPGGTQAHPAVYPILFFIAALFGISTVTLLRRTPDLPEIQARTVLPLTLRQQFNETWRHIPLRRFLLFRMVWLFATNLAVPYYMIYMLQNLRLSFTEISILQNVGALAALLSTPFWGKIIDKLGYNRVTLWTSWLKVFYVVGWAFVSGDMAFWLLIALHISLVVDVGLNLCAGNMLMNMMPRQDASNIGHFSTFTAVTSLAAAAGPFLAGLLLSISGSLNFMVLGIGLGAIQLVFILSGLVRVLSLVLFRDFLSSKAEKTAEI